MSANRSNRSSWYALRTRSRHEKRVRNQLAPPRYRAGPPPREPVAPEIPGDGDGPVPVPEAEIEGVRRPVTSTISVDRHPYLHVGDWVEVIRGPLAGPQGILLRKGSGARLVIGVRLIERAVSIGEGFDGYFRSRSMSRWKAKSLAEQRRGPWAMGSVSMRIGIATYYLDLKGGTQRVVLNLARELQLRGHTVRIFTLAIGGACFRDLQAGLDIRSVIRLGSEEIPPWRHLKFSSRTGILAHKLLSLRYEFDLQRRMEQQFVRLLGEEGNDVDILNPHEGGALPWACLRLRPNGAGVVWQCNEPLGRNTYRDFPSPALRRVVNWPQYAYPLISYDRFRMRHIRQISVLDSTVARLVETRYGKAPRVIHCGVTPEWIRPAETKTELARKQLRTMLRLSDDAFIVGAIGHWGMHKRYEDIVRAVSSAGLGEVETVICGSASLNVGYLEFVRADARSLGLGHHLHIMEGNSLSDSELRNIYDGFDVFVFPNSPQTWGLAVIEAMARGLPVVVSRGSGVSEIIKEGQTGFTFPSRDVRALGHVIKKLAQSAEMRIQIGQAARDEVSRRMLFSRYVDVMESMFCEERDHRDARCPA